MSSLIETAAYVMAGGKIASDNQSVAVTVVDVPVAPMPSPAFPDPVAGLDRPDADRYVLVTLSLDGVQVCHERVLATTWANLVRRLGFSLKQS